MTDATTCEDCGAPLDEGAAKCFTVCDACWDKAYANFRRIREMADALAREEEMTA